MEKKPLAKRGRPSKLGEVKAVIAALSITFTLALWNVFSRPEEAAVATEVSQPEITTVTEAPVAILDLPPMPTLIPSLAENAMEIPMTQAGSGMQTISPTVVPPSGKILLGGSQPGTTQPRQGNKKPSARTRSSQ